MMMSDTDLKKLFRDSQDFQNVFEVEVPEQSEQRLKCNIDFVDEMYGEGFVPGTVTLFTGDSGAGKSTLSMQIANGFAAQNITTAYNSSEQHVSQIKKTVDRLRLDHPFYVSNSNNFDNVIRQCKQNDVKVLFIDSLQTIGCGKYDPDTGKAKGMIIQKAIEFAQKTFSIVFIVGHVTKNGQFAGKNSYKHMVDVHLHMKLCVNENCLLCVPGTRTLVAQKNRWSASNVSKQLMLWPGGFKPI